MYADREESESRRSVKERLNGNSLETTVRRRQITGKRQRDDDKWEHDLYEDNESQASNRKVGARDLRLKLQKKSLHAPQSGKSSMSGVRDLREKLSVPVYSVTVNNNPPKPKLEAAKSAKKNETVDAPPAVIKKAAIPPARKKASQKNDTSVDGFLHCLGLEKYSITFQAEEVDMAALVHMSDEDLKALGIPMAERNCEFGLGFTLELNHMCGPKKKDNIGVGIKSMKKYLGFYVDRSDYNLGRSYS